MQKAESSSYLNFRSFLRATVKFTVLISTCTVMSCQSPSPGTASKTSPATVPRAAPTEVALNPQAKSDPNLTQNYATFRSDILSKVTYDLKINATGSSRFSGQVSIGFDMNQSLEKPLLLDFRSGGNIGKLTVNGQLVSEVSYVDGKIALPAALLIAGHNLVDAVFERAYSTDGNGLYRFTDPEDERVYLWTQFEAYFANSMFPCFDQPDLKATFRFEATVPESWQVISVARESAVSASDQKKNRVWTFKESPPISTYLFSFFAGPYAHWESLSETDLGRVPLRLYARQSLKRYVHPEDWFRITRAGLDYYGHLFNYPFPFTKYDQLIVPDFNDGGMENIASVAIGEDYISRGLTSRFERERIADLVLHEMAHMWFGDLVTMKWWNGLWLNESFASYMSARASVAATEFKEAWLSFHEEMKEWAYVEDQLVTTHPIDSDIPDTKTAENAFDGITYGKGASSLQQLEALVGADAFREGIRSYFKAHDYQNARLADFVSELGRSSRRDLVSWARGWLMSAGVDKIRSELSCDSGKIKTLQLFLTPPEGSFQERTHKIKIGLFSHVSNHLSMTGAFDVELGDGKVDSAVGQSCPEFILPNVDDRDYIKVEVGPEALRFVKANVNSFNDPLVRMMLWNRMFEMVTEAQLAPADYIELAAKTIAVETDLHVSRTILSTLAVSGREGSAFYYLARSGGGFSNQVASVENAVWKKLLAADVGSDRQRVYLGGFIASAYTSEAQKKLRDVLNGRYGLKAPVVDQDRRWQMVVRLMSLGGSQRLLEDEKKRDPSERGQQMALAGVAAAPDMDAKFKILTNLVSDDEMSMSRKDAVLRNVLPPWQDSLRERFADRFYETVTHLTATEDQEFTDRFARNLMPALCDPLSTTKIQNYLQEHQSTLAPAVLKTFRVSLQQNQRCVKVRHD